MDQGETTAYYSARVAEYERIYAKPERQDDLARLREIVAAFGRGRQVLELACGTGYWTAILAPDAVSVAATDIGEEVMAIARAKPLLAARVTFWRADAYALDAVPGEFNACFAGFWWSHVPRNDLVRFLSGLHRRLGSGTRVLFLDNRYVEGSSTPIVRTDLEGNTYQRRPLADGTIHEVLKNFPSAAEVHREVATAGGSAVEVIELPYYWYVIYEVGPSNTPMQRTGTMSVLSW